MSADSIAKVRRFNRFYTQQIGVLEEGLLRSRFSLAEARVLYELAHHPGARASQIGEALSLDTGYLSRILKSFQGQDLVQKRRCPKDGRQSLLELTEAGLEEFRKLDGRSDEAVSNLLQRLSPNEGARLVACMTEVEQLLSESPQKRSPVLRPPRPGELGWMVAQHGELYAKEYGWGFKFEGLVGAVVAEYAQAEEGTRQQCWIADIGGRPVGSAMIVQDAQDPEAARVRLVLVHPRARGRGLGRSLVQECIEFARLSGYKRIVLWTQSVLKAARAIYQEFGFSKIQSEQHTLFGPVLEGETWELEL